LYLLPPPASKGYRFYPLREASFRSPRFFRRPPHISGPQDKRIEIILPQRRTMAHEGGIRQAHLILCVPLSAFMVHIFPILPAAHTNLRFYTFILGRNRVFQGPSGCFEGFELY
jgi:hypothetical protein